MIKRDSCDKDIDAMIEAIQNLSSSERGRVYALIQLLASISEPARPQSAQLLCEISQVIRQGGRSRFDIIDLMIDYLRLQSAAALEARFWPTSVSMDLNLD